MRMTCECGAVINVTTKTRECPLCGTQVARPADTSTAKRRPRKAASKRSHRRSEAKRELPGGVVTAAKWGGIAVAVLVGLVMIGKSVESFLNRPTPITRNGRTTAEWLGSVHMGTGTVALENAKGALTGMPPDPLAVPALLEALGRPKAGNFANGILKKFGPEEARAAIDMIPSGMDSDVEKARQWSARLLGLAGEVAEPHCQKLGELLKNDKSISVRVAAAEALGQIGLSTETLEYLDVGLEDESVQVVEVAARQYGSFGAEARAAVPTLLDLLSRREAEVRAAAVESLKLVGLTGDDLPSLIAILQKGNADASIEACRLLGSMGDSARSVIPTLLDALKNAKTGPTAVEALLEIADDAESVVPAFLEAFTHADRWHVDRRASLHADFSPGGVHARTAVVPGYVHPSYLEDLDSTVLSYRSALRTAIAGFGSQAVSSLLAEIETDRPAEIHEVKQQSIEWVGSNGRRLNSFARASRTKDGLLVRKSYSIRGDGTASVETTTTNSLDETVGQAGSGVAGFAELKEVLSAEPRLVESTSEVNIEYRRNEASRILAFFVRDKEDDEGKLSEEVLGKVQKRAVMLLDQVLEGENVNVAALALVEYQSYGSFQVRESVRERLDQIISVLKSEDTTDVQHSAIGLILLEMGADARRAIPDLLSLYEVARNSDSPRNVGLTRVLKKVIPEIDSKALSPVTAPVPPVRPESVAASQAPFRVTVHGEGVRDLICVSGLGCGEAVWETTVQAFAKDYRLHLVTLGGFDGVEAGMSPRCAVWSDGLAEWITAEKINAPVLIGHGLGGYVGLRLGIDHPGAVSALIVVDTLPLYPPLGPNETMKVREEQATSNAEAMRKLSSREWLEKSQMIAVFQVSDQANLNVVRNMYRASDRDVLIDATLEMSTLNLGDRTSQIDVPLVVIAPISTAGVKQGRARLVRETIRKKFRDNYEKKEDVEFVFIQNARHFIMFDQPDVFLESITSSLEKLSKP